MMEIFNLASTRIRNYKLTWKNVQNKITDGTLPFEEFVNDLNTYTSMSYQEFQSILTQIGKKDRENISKGIMPGA